MALTSSRYFINKIIKIFLALRRERLGKTETRKRSPNDQKHQLTSETFSESDAAPLLERDSTLRLSDPGLNERYKKIVLHNLKKILARANDQMHTKGTRRQRKTEAKWTTIPEVESSHVVRAVLPELTVIHCLFKILSLSKKIY